ncbi:hypothetical protein ACC677_38695, partial [Rhizobium ruizarguesonis]
SIFTQRSCQDLSVFRDQPLHKWASHGADAFGGLAIIFTGLAPEPLKPEPKRLPTLKTTTFNDFVAATPAYSERV